MGVFLKGLYMATRIERILSNARLTLADPQKQRWDDDTLIAILNEAQIDFCQQTKILHDRVNVPIIIEEPYFELPDDCWQLTRVLYDNKIMPLVSHQDLDEIVTGNSTTYNFRVTGTSWEQTRGKPSAIIYDRRNMLEGKIYPIPTEGLDNTEYLSLGTETQLINYVDLYGTITSGDYEIDGVYGITTSLATLEDGYQLNDLFGEVTDVLNTNEEDKPADKLGIAVDVTGYTNDTLFGFVDQLLDDTVTTKDEDEFGLIHEIKETSSYLKCYYLKNPIDIVDSNSELSIPSMFDIALKFYLCGQAFMNDIDTAYQQKGSAQMLIYERHVATAKRNSASDFTRASQFETNYRVGV